MCLEGAEMRPAALQKYSIQRPKLGLTLFRPSVSSKVWWYKGRRFTLLTMRTKASALCQVSVLPGQAEKEIVSPETEMIGVPLGICYFVVELEGEYCGVSQMNWIGRKWRAWKSCKSLSLAWDTWWIMVKKFMNPVNQPRERSNMILANSAATLLATLSSFGTPNLNILRVWSLSLLRFPWKGTRKARFGGRLSGLVLYWEMIPSHTHIALRSYFLLLSIAEISKSFVYSILYIYIFFFNICLCLSQLLI